jgi:hypothetical protein
LAPGLPLAASGLVRIGPLFSAFGIAIILGALILLCTAVIQYPGFRATQARVSRDSVRKLHEQLTSYVNDHRKCPATAADVPIRPLKDGWGTSIATWCSERGVQVRSAGPDKLFNTADDVTYPVSSGMGGPR